MKITEAQAFAGHPVEMRRGIADAAIRGDVPVCQVVSQKHDEIGLDMLQI